MGRSVECQTESCLIDRFTKDVEEVSRFSIFAAQLSEFINLISGAE